MTVKEAIEREENMATVLHAVLVMMELEDIREDGECKAANDLMATECLFTAKDSGCSILKMRAQFYQLWRYTETVTLDLVRHNGRLHFGLLRHSAHNN